MKVSEALAQAGFEPPFNVCAWCHHGGCDHDLRNICLICGDRFTSMTDDERWVYGIVRLRMLGWKIVESK